MHFQKYSDNEKTGKVGVLGEETNLSDVPDIPDIETVVVVDNAHSSVLLVVGHSATTGMLIIIFINTFQYSYGGRDNHSDDLDHNVDNDHLIYHDHCVLDKPGIWILGIRGVTCHVGDGETLGHVHTKVVSSWQRRDKL